MTDVVPGRPLAGSMGSRRARMVAEDTAHPIRMVDVVREIQAIALAAERSHDPEIVASRRRAQSMLARLRNDFVEDLIGDKAPSERAA